DDLAFTDAETAEFAALRGTSRPMVAACGGWPALAELSADPRAGSPADAVVDYVDEEMLSALPAALRRGLARLAQVGGLDEEVAAAVLDRDVDLADLLAGVPLVSSEGPGQWRLHALWGQLTEAELSPAQRARARARAGTVHRRRGRFEMAVPLLIESG